MQNGHYMTGDGNHHRMVEVDMMGNTIHNWDMLERGYTMHHAISQDKQGNILATVSKTSAKIANGKDVRINDFIIRMDPEKGEILQEWDLVENIDATVIAQKPKLRPYIAQMEENIAKTLGIAKEQINIKATTEEGLGFTGTEEGISSQAICMLNGFYESSMVVGGGSKCAGCPGCSRS